MDYNRITLEDIKTPERFISNPDFLDKAIEQAVGKVEHMLPKYVHSYPSACSVQNQYLPVPNATTQLGSDWTCGFWTGMLWLGYELSGKELLRGIAEAQYDDYKARLKSYDLLHHHDIGFIYMPSILAQYKLTGSKKAKKLCLEAADLLAKRYSEKAGIIQVRERDVQGAFIIDCSMNVPLLFWAARTTGDRSYYLKALNHMTRTVECMVRDDASTYQCYKIDEVTGVPSHGWQGQGHDDSSCWARGQSWVVYGLALCYRYTKEPAFLEVAKRTANYFINRLPSDHICNWDLLFTNDDDARDSSVAPIIACGLLELAGHLLHSDPLKQIYKNAAAAMTQSLAEKYFTEKRDDSGLLLHGVYCKDKGNGGLGDDECCIWGDYYYMEALARLKLDWTPYWG